MEWKKVQEEQDLEQGNNKSTVEEFSGQEATLHYCSRTDGLGRNKKNTVRSGHLLGSY